MCGSSCGIATLPRSLSSPTLQPPMAHRFLLLAHGAASSTTLPLISTLAHQRRSLLAEFYGPQYALFHSGRPLDGVGWQS